MNILLIANNKGLEETFVARHIVEYDLLIMFNHVYLLHQFDCLKSHSRKVLLLRENQTYAVKHELINPREMYFGVGNVDAFDWENVFFVDGDDDWFDSAVANLKRQNVKRLKSDVLLDTFDIQMSKNPSTGFVGYLAAKSWYPEANVDLLGFTCPKELYWHDMSFEQTFYAKNGVRIIGDILFQ